MRLWIRRRASTLVTATSAVIVAVLVAVVAVASNGFEAQRMDLDDGAVWVANADAQVIGRANPSVLELNSVVATGNAEPRIVQSGQTVLLVDEANATLDVVDPALAELGARVALPPESPEVLLAADRAVVHAAETGELWLLAQSEITGFDAESMPTLSLGASSSIALSAAGHLAALAPETGDVYALDVTRSETVESSTALALTGDELSVTTTGADWVVLDPEARAIQSDAGVVDLSAVLPDDGSAVLQLADDLGDGTVVVAASTGVWQVGVADGAVTVLRDDASGTPVRPVRAEGCVFAAWDDGTAWRACDDEQVVLALEGAAGRSDAEFVLNAEQVVLSDAADGATWAVQGDGQLIDNWEQLIVPDEEQEEVLDDEVPPEIVAEQVPPVAVADDLGARPGRSTLLPVLINDYDANGDVLVVTRVEEIDEAIGRLDLVARDQQIQLTLADDARGVIAVRYTISDGRGGTDSAVMRVTVRSESENSPPEQVRSSTATVAAGGRVSTRITSDWVDPDGDPFYLVDARTADPDTVSFTAEGQVILRSGSDRTGSSSIGLTVSDGRAEATGRIDVTTRAAGQVPIVIEPWVVQAIAGSPVTINPLRHASGGSGTLRLNAVPEKSGVRITPSFESGTFVVESERIGSHYLEVTLTDGDLVETGLVRVEVSPVPDAGERPITVPQTVYVTAPGTSTVDPTTTDIDPAGGVLVVTGVEEPETGSGIRAEVLEQREIRVSLTAPLDDGPTALTYTISNGFAEAEGTITIIEIPRPEQVQAPVAGDDTVTVRTGDVVDISVLANDEQPDGDAIALVPELVEQVPDDGGLLFASGEVLRYLAPETAGNYTAIYAIEGEDGQRAQARVRISVREVDEATNSAPTPPTLTARVLAGETVRVEIPLSGTDPDGDSVQLIGIAASPEKGTVVETGSGYIDYTAGEYSAGTDTFTYTVVDGLGARAEGQIRVGISPALDGVRNPVANADSVQVRPGRSVAVQPLLNDSDPDGRALRVVSVEANAADEGVVAEVVDDEIVAITPPQTPGTYSVVYTIENPNGGRSSNFITVSVDPDAPLAYPLVGDSVLSVSDVLDRTSVDVSVLDEVFFADGDVSELGVELVEGYASSAELLEGGDVRVTIEAESQIIPFSVAHPEDDSVRSYGFVRVPGLDDALPQLDRTARELRVNSEDTLRIDINDFVVALGGREVRLVDSGGVRATHDNGGSLVVDAQTLQFTSADRYYGPASITFEVTDGASADDPEGRRAILTLPITVDPRANQPPVFLGAVVEFEPGESRELDLVKLTNYPYDDDVDELTYDIAQAPSGFDVRLNGQRLVLTAGVDTPKGTVSSITLGVRDAINEGSAGVIELRVVPSTRPLAQPVADRAQVLRGETTVVDVLANDQANNPFPGSPLSVVAIRGLDGAALPDGVRITPNDDNSRLTVTVSAAAEPLDTTLQYQLADATGDTARLVWGSVTISVQDVPDPVTAVRVTEFSDRQLRLSWTPGAANNSPIEMYRVIVRASPSGTTVQTVECATSVDCAVPTPGNGPDNAVRLSVVAVNGVGGSTPVANESGPIWSDVIPLAPTALSAEPLDQGLRVSWRRPADSGGSPVDRYVVTVAGESRTVTVSAADAAGTMYSASISGIPGVRNGSSVAYTVSARNSAPTTLATWNQAGGNGVPAWTPIRVSSPSASGVASDDGTTATASWPDAFSPNGRAITDYQIAIVPTGDALPTCTAAESVGTRTNGTFDGLTPDVSYTVVVYASNGLGGCSDPATAIVYPRARPGTVASASFQALDEGPVGRWDFAVDSIGIASGSTTVNRIRYRLSGTGVDGSDSGLVAVTSPLTTGNSSHYGVAISVQIKACQVWDEVTLCSNDWSAPFSVGVPVANTVPGNLSATIDEGSGGLLEGDEGDWAWTSAPSGAYTAVEYRCDSDAAWTTMGSGVGTCRAPSQSLLGLSDQPQDLVVRITANGTTYLRSYDWNDYD